MANKCARCGWHYLKHGPKDQCPAGTPGPDGSKPRFTKEPTMPTNPKPPEAAMVEQIVVGFSDKIILRLDIDEDDARLAKLCDEMRNAISTALRQPAERELLSEELEHALNAPTWALSLMHVHNAVAALAKEAGHGE